MKAIFRQQLQYRKRDELYDLSAIPPIGEQIAVNGVWWNLECVRWVADVDKKECYPILNLVSVRDMTEGEIKVLENTQE